MLFEPLYAPFIVFRQFILDINYTINSIGDYINFKGKCYQSLKFHTQTP
jgi:hypothetical protein